MRVIYRDYSRTETDDWKLNVQPYMSETEESVPIYHDGTIVGWKVQPKFS
jgi:hypothetical protein